MIRIGTTSELVSVQTDIVGSDGPIDGYVMCITCEE